MLNQSETIPRSFLVGFESIELVATMCALNLFVRHFRTFSDSTDGSFVEIAEALIIRLQDVLDEDQIRKLCVRD